MSLAWIMVPLLQVLSVAIFFVIFFAIIFSAIIARASGTGATVDIATILGLLVAYAASAFIISVFNALMLYRLVKRRNSHFTRELFLYEDLTRAAKEAAAKKGIDVSVSLNNLERLRRDASVDERARDPILWSAILVFAAGATIPSFTSVSGFSGIAVVSIFAQYYVYYFLMKEWFRHERREDYFLYEFSRIMAALGVNVAPPVRAQHIPDRSFIVYLILSIFTVGFYGVYWVYVLLSDPNHHFRYQAMVEDAVVAQLSAMTV